MAMLKKLKQAPLSSAWRLQNITDRYEFYISRNGRRVARDRISGDWYSVKKC